MFKQVTIEELEFSLMERKIYDSIFADAKHAYDTFTTKGVVGKQMSNILVMLMRLRRAVLHPSLIQRSRSDDDDEIVEVDGVGKASVDVNALIAQFSTEDEASEDQKAGSSSDNKRFAVDVLKDLKNIEDQECPLCLDTMQDPVLIPECHHAR